MVVVGIRFWSKVNACGINECWEWEAQRRNGYGRFVIGGRTYQAHRIAYEFAVKKIPAGLVIDHLCKNIACVNPGEEELSARAQVRLFLQREKILPRL